ncbi:unnamed protein product, partial [Heterotrigona itama]
VHEDRGDEDRRRASGQTRVGGEVAGLEDVGDYCAATLTPSVPGAAGIKPNRRTRPLSLAVQPLNYRRFDPDPRITIDIVASHRPNMTSQESIGSCSLDVDQSASDRSENTVDTISKKTLHSLNLSCNGDSVSSPENLANGSSETLQKSHLSPDEKLNVSNGHRSSPEPEQLTVKKPSYLGLACSISGYSGINRYDSKLREGFRSRDSSPGTRSNENLNVPAHPYPPKSQSISPLAMDRQNGFSNGLKEECKVETYRESRSSIGICQGYSEVDKGVLHTTTYTDISPVQASTPTKRSPGISQMMSCSQQNKHFSVSPKQPTVNLSNASFSETSILNGTMEQVENQTINSTTSSEKSFIQQRVERLYGPGALAQGFFFRRSTSKLSNTDSSFNKSTNNNDVSTENANAEESLKNLPVLRHLRPEFRAQLPVVSPRRPTDGSEQILKPLQRVTPVSRKAEQKPKIPAAKNLDGNLADSGAQKLNSSVTSIPDQQPAAPKVVLPVLEPSASSTNVAKQVQEAEKTVEERNGHYFMKLLKQETDRLLSLAASAEAELASGDTVALPEEAAGKLRSAAGKARLLASQKMQQFEGLCQKNINQVPGEEFPTTSEDLAGFWDMVMLQVVQVNELFDQIEKLRNSQWQEVRSVSVHPQTIDRLKPPENNSHSHDNSGNVTSAELPSRRSYSHSLTNKRVRSNDATFSDPKDPKHDSYNYPIAEQFAFEMRLCDDAFQALTVPRNLEGTEAYCEDHEVDYLCENITEIQSMINDSFSLNRRTSYVVSYTNKFEVLFEKEDVEFKQQSRDCSFDKPRGDYSESMAKDGGRIAQEKENDASGLKTTFPSNKGIDRKMGKVRSKAKSRSATERNPKQEMQVKNDGGIRPRALENKQRRNDSIKSGIGEQQSCSFKPVIIQKRAEEKVATPSKSDKSPYKSLLPSREESVKKLARSVAFSNDIKEPLQARKNVLFVDQDAEKIAKLPAKNILHTRAEKDPLKAKKLSHNYRKKRNLSVVNEIWSNLDFVDNNRKSRGMPDAPVENCTFAGTWNVKRQTKERKREQVKDSVEAKTKKIEKEAEASSVETAGNVFWKLSDSRPFVPLSQETLRQLRQIYNVENQMNLSSVVNRSVKLERMKVYDKRRKKVLKVAGDKPLKQVISNHLESVSNFDNLSESNFIEQLDTRDANTTSLRDHSEAASQIVNPTPENHDFSMQCFISLTNFTPCLVNSKNESTLVINNITNNIATWPERNDEIRNFLSTLISSVSSEILSKVAKRDSSKSEKRVSIRRLSYGLIARNVQSSNASANVITDISQNVRPAIVARRLPNRKYRESIESIDFDNYLPLKKRFHVNRYLEDVKYVQLIPDNVKVRTHSSDAKSFPVKTVPEKKTMASTPQNGTTAKRRVAPIHKSKSTANSEANKKAREAREQARRQLIEERRRAMRSNAQNSENT